MTPSDLLLNIDLTTNIVTEKELSDSISTIVGTENDTADDLTLNGLKKKDSKVVHLSGDETLSGLLSVDLHYEIRNPFFGFSETSCCGRSSYNIDTVVGAPAEISGAYFLYLLMANSPVINEISSYEIREDGAIRVVKDSSFCSYSWYGSTLNCSFGDNLIGYVEITAQYDDTLPGDSSGFNMSDMLSTNELVLSALSGIALLNTPVYCGSQTLSVTNWGVYTQKFIDYRTGLESDTYYQTGTTTPFNNALWNGFIFAPASNVEFLSTWREQDEFALQNRMRNEIEEISSTLNNSISKALTAETDPKFRDWKLSTSVDAGKDANSSNNSVAVGLSTNANFQSVAIGLSSYATASSIAIGSVANAQGGSGGGRGDSIAIGRYSNSTGNSSIAVGKFSQAVEEFSMAIGNDSYARAGAIALGGNARGMGFYSVVAGSDAETSNNYSIAIGVNTKALENSSIAIGHNVVASGRNSIQLGGTDQTAISNNVDNAFQVWNYTMLDRNTGRIPEERIASSLQKYVPLSTYQELEARVAALEAQL